MVWDRENRLLAKRPVKMWKRRQKRIISEGELQGLMSKGTEKVRERKEFWAC